MNVKWRLGIKSESTFGEGLEKNGTHLRGSLGCIWGVFHKMEWALWHL